MSVFRRKQKESATPGAKSKGLRFSERLLPVFGPAQVGDSTTPIRPTTGEEDAREEALEHELVRKVGADGTTYLVSARDA